MLTIAGIKKLLKEERLSISKYRGQNFLVDAHLQKKIIQALNINSTDEIIEIGSGLGALTEDLAMRAAKVIALEKDKGMARVLGQALSKYNNLKIINRDILKVDVSGLFKRQAKVVGNLPFYITTPIIGLLLKAGFKRFSDVFITVQHEVAKRLVSKQNHKNYSSLSVFIQYFTHPIMLFTIPKKAFYPQPRVDSVFMHLRLLSKPAVSVRDEEQFFKIVHRSFSQRRKTIVNSLSAKLGKEEKKKIEQALKSQGLKGRLRAENLYLSDFARIEDVFCKRGIRF